MNSFNSFTILIVLAAVFAYLNHRFLKLAPAIGIMLLALISSLLLIAVRVIYPDAALQVSGFVHSIDFSSLLLGSMLSFLLFAGATHINLNQLKQEKWAIMVFSSLSVVLSTLLTGLVLFYLLAVFHIGAPLIDCFLFGALISPTDPIAVLGILRKARISRSLEMKIAGESLFNDGVAVVVFLTILQVAEQPDRFSWSDTIFLFCREALGGLAFGVLLGYAGLLLLRSIDQYKVEILISLALVTGGYSLANQLGVSGPLAMVAAGILIGNPGNRFAMSHQTKMYFDSFWELIDESLNAILFVLMGLELLLLHLEAVYFILGPLMILLVLCIRYLSVLLPAQLIQWKEKITHKTILLLTWGGLRGGISIALALSLQEGMHKDLWVSLTYFIVAFSILIQGLTAGRLALFLGRRSGKTGHQEAVH